VQELALRAPRLVPPSDPRHPTPVEREGGGQVVVEPWHHDQVRGRRLMRDRGRVQPDTVTAHHRPVVEPDQPDVKEPTRVGSLHERATTCRLC
jgi:hypothetical protein